MAESDDLERTESPTQKRLEEARKRGQVARSRDLAAAVTTLGGGAALYNLGGSTGAQLLAMMRNALSFSQADAIQGDRMLQMLVAASHAALIAMIPLLGLLLVATVLAPLLLGGWTFSGSVLAPQWERLDPVAGMGRVFSQRGWIEVLKSLARFAVVAVVSWLVIRQQFPAFTHLGAESSRAGIAHALQLCGMAFILIGSSLAIIALIDVPLTLWQHHKSLRMSLQEIRDEARETEGNPEVRGRIRRTQQDMAKRRMMSDVPKADVVVMNPTHYAVALRYDDQKMRAPMVVAKGTDLIALQIRMVATAHNVPVIEAPPLARALHASCQIGGEVPGKLYAAVAQLLTYVYQLRAAVRVGRRPPAQPSFDNVEA
jgi:flagellar biosynthetic protein FlhB